VNSKLINSICATNALNARPHDLSWCRWSASAISRRLCSVFLWKDV